MSEYSPQDLSFAVYSILTYIDMNLMDYGMLWKITGNSEWSKETNQPTITEGKRN